MAWQTPKTDWHGAIDSEGNYLSLIHISEPTRPY